MRSLLARRRHRSLLRPLRLFSALSAFALFAGPAIPAQTTSPAFDVAVVRPTVASPDGRSHIWSDPSNSHFKTQNESLDGVLQFAFDLPDTRIFGGTPALRHAPFDIEATSDPATDAFLKALPPDAARQRKREMVQALLRDRFHLATHTETRDLPTYDLVIDRTGSKLKPQEADDRPFNLGSDRLSGTGFTSATLAQDLARYAGRIVIDRTGLTGRYAVDLHWSRDNDPSPTLPNFFTAVEEQLGLKLQPSHGPVEVLVIDRLDPPTAN